VPLQDLRGQLGRGGLDVPEQEVAGVPRGMIGQLVRFAAIGVASTVAYLLLYVLFRAGLGPFGANLVALVVTAVANTAANRRLTFGVRGRVGAATSQIQGLIVFGLGLVLTTGALALLPATASRPLELLVLVAANGLATVLRFVAFRWMFRNRSTPTSTIVSEKPA
jgi:putative flippase GtrA